jgi:hypothetical protein
MLVGEAVDATRCFDSANSGEKIFITFSMMIGQAISATIFGSMANLIKNLDQGHDIYTEKMDYVNEHMRYYDIPEELQNDIRQYYDYIWYQHRGMIYGQEHFKHISDKLE